MLKKRIKVMLSLILILTISLVSLVQVRASTLVYLFQQPSYSGISGVTATDSSGIPTNKTVIYSYGLGSTALSNSISWAVSDFTNLSVPSPNTTYQAGVNNTWYGSTAGQVSGTSMGFQVHKDSSTNSSPTGWIYGMQMAYQFSNQNSKPWSYSSTAQLRIQSNFWVNKRSATGTGIAQYGQMFVSLVDTVHQKSIWYCISLWDSRGVQSESVSRDTGGTTNFNVCTHIMGSLRYCSQHPNSQNSAGTASGLWYCAYVSRQNLINAVNDINSAYSAGLSTNPNDYAVNFVGCGPEMYSPSGTDGWIGAGESDCMVISEY